MLSKLMNLIGGKRVAMVVVTLVGLLALSSILVGYRSGPPAAQPAHPASTQPQPASTPKANSVAPAVQPTVDVGSQPVMQNGDFSLSAKGLAPGETVIFSANMDQSGTFREIGRATADSAGQVLNLKIKLPVWLTSGIRTLRAAGQSSGRTVDATFYVRAIKPWIDLGSYAAKQDSSIGLTAGGFKPGETVNVFFEQQPRDVLASAVADKAGNITWSELNLKGLQPGQYNLILVGQNSQIKLTAPIVISPRAPWVELHVYTIGPGGKVGFNGHDFAPGEQVKVYLDQPAGMPLTQAVADEAGNFTIVGAYSAKPGDVGQHRLIFVGNLSGQNISASFSVVPFTPSFQMTTYAGPPGTETSFNGSGFAPGETVTVFVQGIEQPVSTIQVNSKGTFSNAGQFMVPRNANGGNLGITLVGEASGVRLTQQFSVVRIQPFLGLDTYAGQPGTVVRFSGLGFASGENVTIHVGNREGPVAAKVVADNNGKFAMAGSFPIPSTGGQDVTFTAVGESSGAEASVKFQVITPTPPQQP